MEDAIKISKYIGVTGILGFAGFITFMSSIYTVEEGHIGVIKRFSEAVKQVEPGLHFKIPFIDGVEEVEIRTRKNVEIMPIATKEQMRAEGIISVNWTVNRESVLELYKSYGSLDQFETRILDPKLRSAAKESISKFTAEENINQREKVSSLIYETLSTTLSTFPIKTDSLQYEDIKLPDQYLHSIDSKQTAKNERDAENFRLEKQALEAQQKVNTANAERDATKSRADGEAYKIETEAKANALKIKLIAESDAEAIKIKAEALKSNPDLIEYQKAINWNGKLPDTVMGANPGVIMQLK